MENQKALVPVSPSILRSPLRLSRRDSEDAHLLRSVNLRLQYKVHNLENEVNRLKGEVQGYKGKSFIYESLTNDLASLRTQLDKTALALLKKCEAYDTLKKELTTLKSQYQISPKSSMAGMKKISSSKEQLVGSTKRKLAIYHTIMKEDDSWTPKKVSRPSMGSCGNLVKQISVEEAMPSCLAVYAAPSAPLRNRVLMKLHTLRAASTESLESVGRKSLKLEEAKEKTALPKSKVNVHTKIAKPNKETPVKVGKSKPNLNSSVQSLKSSSVKAPPSYRPALGQTNGRVLQMNTSIKRSNSSNSAKSQPAKKPAFRF